MLNIRVLSRRVVGHTTLTWGYLLGTKGLVQPHVNSDYKAMYASN